LGGVFIERVRQRGKLRKVQVRGNQLAGEENQARKKETHEDRWCFKKKKEKGSNKPPTTEGGRPEIEKMEAFSHGEGEKGYHYFIPIKKKASQRRVLRGVA